MAESLFSLKKKKVPKDNLLLLIAHYFKEPIIYFECEILFWKITSSNSHQM